MDNIDGGDPFAIHVSIGGKPEKTVHVRHSVLKCRPVDWAPMARLAPDLPEAIIFPGSVVANCGLCEISVYVGPRQQELMQTTEAGPPVCFLCADILCTLIERADVDVEMRLLGNPYQPKRKGDGT